MDEKKDRTPLLLHACCGPCSLEPVRLLREQGFEPTICWTNPNIAPVAEHDLRLRTLQAWAAEVAHVDVIVAGDDHDVLFALAPRYGLTPVWQDFRAQYPEATTRSRELGMYRQNYCGCRFSAAEAAVDRQHARDARKAARAQRRAAQTGAQSDKQSAVVR